MTTSPDYAALFLASPYPYLLIDTDFILIGANPAYCRATGRTAEDLVGRHIFDAFPADPSDPASTNLDEVRTSIELAVATRRPHTSALLRYAIPHETPDGTVFEARYWSAVHTPVFDAAGNVTFVAQNAIDVTDLYRFDEATKKYYLKQDADAVPDVAPLDRPQMHEAMTRIMNAERGQLQVLFDQAPGFIAVLTGPEHRVDIVNEAFYELAGRRDIVGKPVRDAMPEMAGQGLVELMDDAFGSGAPIVLRQRRVALARRPGAALEERYVDLLFQPIRGDDGRVTGIFAQGNDVTGVQRANRALSEKIEQLEEAQSSQAFQLALAERIRQLHDPDDIIATACEMLGRKLDVSRALYLQVDDDGGRFYIRRDWTADGVPTLAGQTRILDDFGPALIADLRRGIAVRNGDVERDVRTASHADAYRRIGVRASMLLPFVKAGKLHVVLTLQSAVPRAWQEREHRIAQDMAELTWSAIDAAQAQAALRAERDQSQTIFDSMAEGFAMLDRHWTILRMNAEGLRMIQQRAADVIGRNHWDVFPQLRGTPTEAVYRRVMETGRAEIVELFHEQPDGTRVWSEVRVHPSQEGGIAFFFRDITERMTAQQQLQTADRRKDEFLAMLAHELRNPLAPIGAAAQLLQIARLDDQRVRDTSRIIGRQVAHMTHLIDDLLDVSRVTGGLVTLERAPQDIRHVVAEAVEQVTPLLQARGHHLALRLAPEAAMVDGDRKRLVQVLSNILNNAAKYTNEGGNIVLRTDVEDTQVLVEVSDDGIGMAPDLVAHAFDLFAQAERTSDRSAGGLGLGLALVKSLVELHGGTVTCRSAGLGKGSAFTVRLPRLPGAVRRDEGAHGHGRTPADARPLRILVVDDNVDAAAMLAMLLETSGHVVTVAHEGQAGLALARAERPDVCLLDIGLPGMDGKELARRMRGDPDTAGAVLIAVTGYGTQSDRDATAAAGFDHHLVKPVDFDRLHGLLANPGRRAAPG
jgi:PAS domain S-box-containing protein